jgi:hypothetical protein
MSDNYFLSESKEFEMKTLQYGLTTILLTASLSVVADPLKKDVIDHQQKQAQEEIDATVKASPHSEARPAVVTSHKKHSVQSPKAEMIKSQNVATDKAVEDTQAANPEVEGRPAVTSNQKKHSVESHKASLIKSQKKAADKAMKDAETSKPVEETRPAATTK